MALNANGWRAKKEVCWLLWMQPANQDSHISPDAADRRGRTGHSQFPPPVGFDHTATLFDITLCLFRSDSQTVVSGQPYLRDELLILTLPETRRKKQWRAIIEQGRTPPLGDSLHDLDRGLHQTPTTLKLRRNARRNLNGDGQPRKFAAYASSR
ncbi:hypothetical protein SCARD494_00793 [Seiridium cardinale]